MLAGNAPLQGTAFALAREVCAAARPPGGRERPPYNARQTGGITGDGRRCPGVGRLSAPTGHSAPCVGADEIIGPLAGLANGCYFLCYRPLAGLCRAGDLARRLGFAASQGLRDDASIVPPTGLAEGWRLCVATHSRPQCPQTRRGRQFCQVVSGKVPALLMDRIRPKALSPVCRGVPLTRPGGGVCGRAASRSAGKARSAPRLRPARPAAPRRWRAAGPGRP